MADSITYLKRGISSGKEDIHRAAHKLDKGIRPGAFCKTLPLLFPHDDAFLFVHTDGAGTKSALAYIYWKETGDTSVFRGIAHDALVMNVDDLLCVGATGPGAVVSTIGRHRQRIPEVIVREVMEGTQATIDTLNRHGGKFIHAGGETADLPDLVKTMVVDTTVVSTVAKNRFIDATHIRPGQLIVGLASFGKASYEESYNSGIGANGLTSARHDLFQSVYRKYPESFDESLGENLAYTGKWLLEDPLNDTELTMGQAALSPTRTYFPIITAILKECPSKIFGVIHCTGGGQIKCKRFGKNMHFIKDNPFPFPPLFRKLEENIPRKEMFQIFNCGHRMEIYTDEQGASIITDIAGQWGVETRLVGRTESSSLNRVTIQYEGEVFEY